MSSEYAVTSYGLLLRKDALVHSFQEMTTPDGRVFTREEWRYGIENHRDDGPALIEKDVKTGIITNEVWYREGRVHRDDDLPAIIERDLETGAVTECWWHNDMPHRVGGPSSITRASNGVITQEIWGLNGILHRENDPAVIRRNEITGIVVYEAWHLSGTPGRADGPHEIRRDRQTGFVISEKYWQCDMLEDGTMTRYYREAKAKNLTASSSEPLAKPSP